MCRRAFVHVSYFALSTRPLSHTYTHTHIHTYTHTHIHKYTHIHTYTLVHTLTCMYAPRTHMLAISHVLHQAYWQSKLPFFRGLLTEEEVEFLVHNVYALLNKQFIINIKAVKGKGR
mmetsp:Transcript_35271/g.91643  ORF Transcript_35271/g.91643 Transcript_35271/m.91643 type:complete len:117 (-) Transcript_35271:19-369(-)